MLVSQGEVRSRIEELRLGCEGYKRQLRGLSISTERRARLESESRLMEKEIATLEKIAQLGHVEEDRERIEAIVRERLEVLQKRMAEDSATSRLQPDEYEYTSGEYKALLWAVGEDRLTMSMRQNIHSRGLPKDDSAASDQAVANTLTRALREGRTPDIRAGAAYDIGRLHIIAALPELAAALNDHPQVAQVARQALAAFSSDELKEGGLLEEGERRTTDDRR